MKVRIDGEGALIPAGERLLDAADDHPELGLRVSCRSAHCGACLVVLRSDASGVAPPSERELETLAELGQAGCRLGCQLVLTGETETVELSTAG